MYIYVYRWPLSFGTYRLKSLQTILQLNEGTSLLVGESITTYVTPRNHSWAWNHTKEIHYIFWCLREEGLSDCRQKGLRPLNNSLTALDQFGRFPSTGKQPSFMAQSSPHSILLCGATWIGWRLLPEKGDTYWPSRTYWGGALGYFSDGKSQIFDPDLLWV